MTYRPTEYQTMKRLLFWHAEQKEINRHEANKIIKDSVEAAYANLDDHTRQWLDVNLGKLDPKTGGKMPQFSQSMALELLAAVGDVLNGRDDESLGA